MRRRPPAARVTEFPTRIAGVRLAVIFTGDEGTTDELRALAAALARDGTPSVAVAPWRDGSTPVGVGGGVDALVRTYLRTWDRQRLILIGLARGAGTAPFVANRLRGDVRSRIDALVLVDPPPRAAFRGHRGWGSGVRPTDLPVRPELERLRGVPMLCLSDPRGYCASLDRGLVQVLADGSDARVIRQIVAFLQ
ncbi:MAG: hypothetical protein IT361_13735 [Gemmatimonadaceae bacterium]|nr:hypothetical protein [Gemmatimonadaceae bacterium]